MEHTPVRYVVLRDRSVWEQEGVSLSGLQSESDGVMTLTRVPGASDGQPIVRVPPYDVALSGVAIAGDRDVYLSNTTGHAVVLVMRGCEPDRLRIGRGAGRALGQFDTPSGLAISGNRLHVADRSNGRIVVLQIPTLEVLDIWDNGLQQPVSLAADSEGRIYVLDAGLNTVRRFEQTGTTDVAYDGAFSVHSIARPVAIAIGLQDLLYVADESGRITTFGPNGDAIGLLPTAGAPRRPGVMAVHGERLYVADVASGSIWIHQTDQGWAGTLPDYRGPVSAMVVGRDGCLYLKPGADEDYMMLEADAACVGAGVLLAGPFDAGEQSRWERVHIDAELPVGASAELRVFTSPPAPMDPLIPERRPADSDWADAKTLASSLDTLVPFPPAIEPAADGTRYLWMRLLLTTTDPRSSPRLLQIEAATPAPSYIDHLPVVYRKEDEPARFLERWLAWLRTDLGDWEDALDSMPRAFDPATASVDGLSSLARWLAFRLPRQSAAADWRRQLADVHRLYERRGTRLGLREFCELYTGAHPQVFEAFHDRHVWQLGHPASTLGFGTGLAPALPDGMIVPGFLPADPAYRGLRGEYYSGTNFDRLELTRVDAVVEVDLAGRSPVPGVIAADQFSIRWTGQVQPRYTELYTFLTGSDDGVRLWVNGRLIIDDWHDHGLTENRGQIALIAGHWYAITLEYYDIVSTSSVSLSWLSASQAKEIIPRDRLYAIVDESVRLESVPPETLLIGQTVVGESGPLSAADFGAPLFSDTAHLFTVLVPAAELRDAGGRELLKEIVETERPAHTDFHLCFVEPRMRVGFQARVGIDSIVAGPPEPMLLGAAQLDLDSYLGDDDLGGATTARIGKRAVVGRDSVAGSVEQR